MSFITLSKETDVIGTDRYRNEDAGVPLAFRESISHQVAPNGQGTSNSTSVKVTVPVVTTVNGVATSNNAFIMTAKFTALQQITSDVERARCYDDAIRFLIATRNTNLQGQLPQVASLPAKWQEFDVAAAAAAMK